MYLDWHFSPHPVSDAQTANSLLSARGISGVKLGDDEYQFSQEQHAGYQAWYLVQLAKSGNVSLPISWTGSTDAYFVTLSPATGSTGVTIDGASTADVAGNYFQYGQNWGQTTGVGDMYDGTANWSFVAGSTAQLHFTGAQVALHAVRDVDQGQMLVSVDGSAPTTVDDYAPSRNVSGVVWTSPGLATGAHVVTITVGTGKNPASSGTNIALDRADIS